MFYHSTRRHIPECLNIQQYRCERLKEVSVFCSVVSKTSNYQMCVPLTPSGTEPASFRLLARCLNQQRQHVHCTVLPLSAAVNILKPCCRKEQKLSHINQTICQTLKQVLNTKPHKQTFSGSRITACGQTDVASQTGTFSTASVQNAPRTVPMTKVRRLDLYKHVPVRRLPLTAEARFRSQVSQCEMCGGQSGTGTGFSPSTSVFPCQYHSAFAITMLQCTFHTCILHNQTFLCFSQLQSLQSTATVPYCSV
jgi:hypothetical protein